MNRISGIMSSLHAPVKALVITIMAMIFSHFVIYDLMSVSFFAPMEKTSDFRFSDFYNIVTDSRPVAVLDSNIVVVAVDNCNRKDIARALDDIGFCGPAAVGLDIAFTPPSDPDCDPLVESLAMCPRLVMPVSVADSGGVSSTRHVSYYDAVVAPSAGYAAVNIQGEQEERISITKFSPEFHTSNGTVPSMPAALAAIADQEAAKYLKDRDNDEEIISYASRRFEVMYPNEILDNTELLEGKIVLVGKLRDSGDQHITPIGNYTPGVMIHAYALSTILSGDFTVKLSDFWLYGISAVLCFFMVWINLLIMQSPFGQLMVRVLQTALLYIMIILGTLMFAHLNIDLDFSYSMLVIALGVASCEVYSGIFDSGGLIDKLINLYTKIRIYLRNTYEKGKQNHHTDADSRSDADAAVSCSYAESLPDERQCHAEEGE